MAYKFTTGAVLQLTSQNSTLNLRSPVAGNGAVDGKGGTGVAAKWIVYSSTVVSLASSTEQKDGKEVTTSYTLVQLQRYADTTYFLRIYPTTSLNALGLANQTPNYLQVTDASANVVIMTSNDYSNCRVGILSDGSAKSPDDTGFGIAAQFSVADVSFTSFDRVRETVRLTNVTTGKSLRFNPNGTIDAEGGRGPRATVVLKLVDAKNRTVVLQSGEDPTRHLRINEDGSMSGLSSATDEVALLHMKKIHATSETEGDVVFYQFQSQRHPDHSVDFRDGSKPIFRVLLTHSVY